MNQAEDDQFIELKDIIHIRIQSRNRKKCYTIVEGVSPDFDLKKILKRWRKDFNCNGTVMEEKDGLKIFQLTGDQRQQIKEFLEREGIAIPENIKVHGA